MLALLWTAFIVLAVWMLLVRPQRRRMQMHQALVAGLAPGHHVVTAGGIHGTIVDLSDDELQLEIASGTVIRVDRRAISRDFDQVAPEAGEDSLEEGRD